MSRRLLIPWSPPARGSPLLGPTGDGRRKVSHAVHAEDAGVFPRLGPGSSQRRTKVAGKRLRSVVMMTTCDASPARREDVHGERL